MAICACQVALLGSLSAAGGPLICIVFPFPVISLSVARNKNLLTCLVRTKKDLADQWDSQWKSLCWFSSLQWMQRLLGPGSGWQGEQSLWQCESCVTCPTCPDSYDTLEFLRFSPSSAVCGSVNVSYLPRHRSKCTWQPTAQVIGQVLPPGTCPRGGV